MTQKRVLLRKKSGPGVLTRMAPFWLTKAICEPQHPFMCHHLPYMVKQRSTSQKYSHPLAPVHCVKRSEKYLNFTQSKQASN